MKTKLQTRRKTKANAVRDVAGQSRARQTKPAMGQWVAYIPASEAKNRFAAVLEDVSKGQEVFITKHNTPKAVVISVERFSSLSAAASSMLNTLTADFDARLARMQTPAAQIAMRDAFHASPDRLGKAAVKAARSRK
jgi:antitoxin Phd